MDARLSADAVACPDCDLLQLIPPLAPGGKAVCVRCGRALASRPGGPADLPLALSVAAAILLIVANTVPLMELRVAGRFASTTIAGGVFAMWAQGQLVTSVLVAFCALIAPAGYVSFMLIVLLAARRATIPQWAGELLRWIGHLQVWAMLEVVMLGILVALVKIAQLATVVPGAGIYAFGAVIVLIPAIMVHVDRRELWQRVEWMRPRQ